MGDSVDIYNNGRKLENALERIRGSEILKVNKNKILEFYSYCLARGLSTSRLIKYLHILLDIASLLQKPFANAKKKDLIRLIEEIERKDYSDWTKHDYKVILKIFYRWLRKTEDYPEEVRWIKATVRNNNLLPEELLSKEDVDKLVEAAYHPRDKALIQVLYDSGCRVGEVLSLKIKNVQFDDYGAVLLVNGKTGQRRVRVVASSPALSTWKNNHPLKDNPDAPFWLSIGTRNRNSPLTYAAVTTLLKLLARKAGIKKRIYPHLFRHSRATSLANHLTEAQMKQYFGWVQSSKMASTYVHLSGRDIDGALLKLSGISVESENKKDEFQVKICPRCKAKNGPASKFCDACGLCLDTKTAMQIDETREKVDRLMDELIKNPKVLDALLEGIEKLKEGRNDLSLNSKIIINGSGERAKRVQERKD